jgi:glycosyltransferase involved in cell wall biosynthesis
MTPLVSIIIPTYDRVSLLLERSLPSVLTQTFGDFEVLIVGDGSPSLIEQRVRAGLPDDSRVSYTVIERQNYPENPFWAWNVRGSKAINYGLDHAMGEWVSTLGDDDELLPDCLEVLLDAAEEKNVDLIYGRSEIVGHGFLGDGNPRHAGQTNHALWKLDDTRMDLSCYDRLPNDWDLFSRYIQKHTWGFIPLVVHRYYPVEHIPGCSPT